MALTGRLKALLGVAVAVVIYVVATAPKDEPAASAAPARAQDAPRPAPAATPAGEGARAAAPRDVSSAGSDEAARLFARLSHRVSDEQSAGALFKSQSWYTPPPPAPVVAQPVVAEAPPAPVAPPVPFSVMGRYARAGERTTYFLTRGDRVFDVHVGDTIDNTYSVDADTGGQLQLTYKPLNQKQTLPIGGS